MTDCLSLNLVPSAFHFWREKHWERGCLSLSEILSFYSYSHQRWDANRKLQWCSDLLSCLLSRELKQRRRRRQRERQKSNRFRLTKQQFCTCISLFWTISLPLLHDYFVKVPNFTFCWGRERRRTTFFFFSVPELWYSLLAFNSRKICQHLMNWTSLE